MLENNSIFITHFTTHLNEWERLLASSCSFIWACKLSLWRAVQGTPYRWVICVWCGHDGGDVQTETKFVSLILTCSLQSLIWSAENKPADGEPQILSLGPAPARVITCCLTESPHMASNGKVILHFSSWNTAMWRSSGRTAAEQYLQFTSGGNYLLWTKERLNSFSNHHSSPGEDCPASGYGTWPIKASRWLKM